MRTSYVGPFALSRSVYPWRVGSGTKSWSAFPSESASRQARTSVDAWCTLFAVGRKYAKSSHIHSQKKNNRKWQIPLESSKLSFPFKSMPVRPNTDSFVVERIYLIFEFQFEGLLARERCSLSPGGALFPSSPWNCRKKEEEITWKCVCRSVLVTGCANYFCGGRESFWWTVTVQTLRNAIPVAPYTLSSR